MERFAYKKKRKKNYQRFNIGSLLALFHFNRIATVDHRRRQSQLEIIAELISRGKRY